jgi:predicted alpha/beta-hydrolase family hydrolase
MQPYVSGLAERGLEAIAIELPRSGRSVVPAEKAVDSFREQVRAGDAVGGHSYGGRVAGLLAASSPTGPASDEAGPVAVVFFSYPLHPPGKPEAWDARTEHWSSIACPVLLMVGDADPFVRHEVLERAVQRLRQVELVVVPGGRHGLHRSARFPELLDRTAAFLRR